MQFKEKTFIAHCHLLLFPPNPQKKYPSARRKSLLTERNYSMQPVVRIKSRDIFCFPTSQPAVRGIQPVCK